MIDYDGGADGIGFAFHPGEVGSVGASGANMGIGGLPDAFGYKFDTYWNDYQKVDPEGGKDLNWKLGWERDPFGEKQPFGAFMKTDSTGWASRLPGEYTLLDKSLILNKNVARPTDSNGWDLNENDPIFTKGFVPVRFYYDGKGILSVYFNGKEIASESIHDPDDLNSFAMAVSASTGDNYNLQQFKFESFRFTGAKQIYVEKNWHDNDNANNTRPSEVPLEIIYVEGQENLDPNNDAILNPDKIKVLELPEGQEAVLRETEVTDENGEIVKKWIYENNDLPLRTTAESPDRYYMVREKESGEYLPFYSGKYSSDMKRYEVQIDNVAEKRQLTIKKQWDGSGTPPDKIKVDVFQDGGETPFKTVTLKEADDWQTTINVPAGVADGQFNGQTAYKLHTYTVKEHSVVGFEATEQSGGLISTFPSDNEDSPLVIKNALSSETVRSIEINKVWVGDEEHKKLRGNKIELELLANGNHYRYLTIEPTDPTDESWKITINNLPVYDGHNQINYSVREINVNDKYTAQEKSTDDGFIITNTFNDNGDQPEPDEPDPEPVDPDEPESEPVDPVDPDEPEPAPVNPDEPEPVDPDEPEPDPGYPYIATRQVKVTKAWHDENNESGHRPNAIQVYILGRNGEVAETITVYNDGDGDNKWFASSGDLPVIDSQGEIPYTLREHDIVYYRLSTDDDHGENGIQGNMNDGYTINNVIVGDPNVFGHKIWHDNDNSLGTRPDEITIELQQTIDTRPNDFKTIQTQVINADDHWHFEFDGLPTYDGDGNLYVYRVREADVAGYGSSIAGSVDDGFIITNTITAVSPGGESANGGGQPTIDTAKPLVDAARRIGIIQPYHFFWNLHPIIADASTHPLLPGGTDGDAHTGGATPLPNNVSDADGTLPNLGDVAALSGMTLFVIALSASGFYRWYRARQA